MVDKYITLCNKISDRYLSFVLTTLCRYNNPKLKSELMNYYKNTNTLFSEIYLEEKRDYPKVEKSEIKKLNFCKEMHTFLELENFNPYCHQFNAWKQILENKNCLITTGTGSGKTECFLYPIFNYLLKVDTKKTKILIIYPLKALSDNQKIRINKNLDKLNTRYNKKISCNVFDGDTPDNERQQIFSNPPDILLTNYSMLDRILTDPKYNTLLQNLDLKYLIIDEIHSYRGSKGIDLSLLIRRLQYNILKSSNNLDKIQYIGTSATLGDKDEIENTVKFIRKIFNLEDNKFNKTNIVESDESEKNIFKLSEIDNNDLFNKEYKIHHFFKKVDPFFRCISCGKLYPNSELKNVCDCGSKSIFEIYTCRNCGKEYYLYFGKVINGNTNNKIKLNNVFFAVGNNIKQKSESMADKDILFLFSTTKDSSFSSEYTLKLSLDRTTNDLSSFKPENQNAITINILVKKQNNKDFIEFNGMDVKNNRFCYCCNQKTTSNREGIIAPLSKISNENSSHIVFDELYSNLGDATNNNRKMLIFTDNVQRSSKFAREIEETHIKNVVRKELLNLLIDQDDYVEFEIMRDKIKSKLNKQGIDENVKNTIILEIYNELIAKSQKVGSLVNRGWIKTKLNYSGDNISNKQLQIIYSWFKNQKLIKECYELSNPIDYNQIRNKGIRKIEEILAKKLEVSISDMKQIFTELQTKKMIIRSQDNLYLINEAYIIIKKGQTDFIELDNYFDNWNYDVPIIKTENDTGKTDSEYRKKIESDFRESQELILIATPTLELGIDIGDLACVGQLYSPPTPANYTQRSGRAGRNSESALVVTYLEDSTLGGYYYFNPPELISGRIYPPSFDLNLEYPISKSIFSLFLQNILSESKFLELFPKNHSWKSIYNWVEKYKEIKEYMSKYYTDKFKLIIMEFSESIFSVKDIVDFDKMFLEWILKLDKCIIFVRSEYNSNQENKDTLTIFRLFGLIPDFAFGSGGTIIKIKDKPSVLGFSLRETCPPSTLDANKRRYKCRSISINKSNIIEFTTKYKICEICKIILIDEQYSVCPICAKNLVSVQRTLFKPQVIYAQEKKFSLNPKKVDWEIILIDPPKNFTSLQKTFKCNIGLKFIGVRGNPEHHICEKCGMFYTDYDKKTVCIDKGKHKILDGDILDRYNTVATHINLNDYLDNKLKDTKILDKTTLNTLLASARLISGCEDGEIDGLRIGDGEFIYFDTVEGGVGFIEIFNTNLKQIFEKAIELCKNPCCTNGCIKCIGSYKRQGDLRFLAKQQILPILEEVLQKI